MKYYEMQHRGSLKEALKTKKEITKSRFNQMRRKYIFWGFDERINCNRYILKNIERNFEEYPVWLLEEKDNEEKTNNDKR